MRKKSCISVKRRRADTSVVDERMDRDTVLECLTESEEVIASEWGGRPLTTSKEKKGGRNFWQSAPSTKGQTKKSKNKRESYSWKKRGIGRVVSTATRISRLVHIAQARPRGGKNPNSLKKREKC